MNDLALDIPTVHCEYDSSGEGGKTLSEYIGEMSGNTRLMFSTYTDDETGAKGLFIEVGKSDLDGSVPGSDALMLWIDDKSQIVMLRALLDAVLAFNAAFPLPGGL